MSGLNSLSIELHHNIVESICHADLKSLRLVNKHFAVVAAWPLFKILHFSGPASLKILPGHDDIPQRNNVEYGRLHEAIDAASALAQYTKTFQFNLAYYREGFWQDYREYIEAQMHEPLDGADLEDDYSEDSDEVEDFEIRIERAVERVKERRNSRLAREASLIEEGERFFRWKMEEQVFNAGRISSALKSLFEAMTALEKVEIAPWEFQDFKELVFDSSAVDTERGDSSFTALMTESLAEAMESADKHVKSLHLTGLDPESLHVTSATRHLFAGLKHLKVDILSVEFMLESAPVSSTFAKLFECCHKTLQSLEIMAGGNWPQLPARGEHDLLKIFSDEQDKAKAAPVFPELRFLGLGSLILNTTSLISFIVSQPQLQSLSFNYIYLATSNIGWPALISSFPDSVKHWRASGQLGHEPFTGYAPPLAYNWIGKWDPLAGGGLPQGCGWKAHPMPDHRWIDFYR
ncbi:hypothetical protein BKA64DRAFT_677812 [Cadophora sp. MPI-SDFR-AT-0126]|nr:hypothetical protein BKA64DRAFT_677812 [Leotiomycetes sp. MPI-SDFR-AT-0126]